MNEKEFDFINVIPLVDVMLVLLTIVLTTSTFIATGAIPIELPKATKNPTETLKTQNIEIDVQGNIFLNGQRLPLEELKSALYTVPKTTPLIIRADRNARVQAFVDVLDLVNREGFKKVAIQTEKRG